MGFFAVAMAILVAAILLGVGMLILVRVCKTAPFPSDGTFDSHGNSYADVPDNVVLLSGDGDAYARRFER